MEAAEEEEVVRVIEDAVIDFRTFYAFTVCAQLEFHPLEGHGFENKFSREGCHGIPRGLRQIDEIGDATSRKNLIMTHAVPPRLTTGEAEIAAAIVIKIPGLLQGTV
jgi:hypothetical protein